MAAQTKMETKIDSKEVRSQAWKFYFILGLWPAYLIFIPKFYELYGVYALGAAIFPGIYLFTWLGYLMHETWHKYVPTVPNALLYNLYSWMLLTDPQLYRLVHGHHHSKVNSYEDTEFHPLGEIKYRPGRILFNLAEILLGVVFLVGIISAVVPRHPRYKDRYRFGRLAMSVAAWALFLGGTGAVSHWLLGADLRSIALSYLLSYYGGSVFLHHSQLVEHGNLIVAGDWGAHNLATRNLSPHGMAARAFLFLSHNDAREHVLHHTLTGEYARPFPGRIPLPPNANIISFADYGRVLTNMLVGTTQNS